MMPREKVRSWLVRAAALALLVSAITAPTGLAAATTTTQVSHIPFEDVEVTNPCNGQTVFFSGTATITTHSTETPTGAQNGSGQFRASGTGVDSSGTTYRLNSHSGSNAAVPLEASAFVLIFKGFYTVVTQGPGPNFVTHFTIITVLTPGGPVTQLLLDDARCVG